MICMKARTRRQKMRKALKHQSCTDHEHEGQCAFDSDQCDSALLSLPAAKGASFAIFQRLIDVAAQALPGGNQAESNSGQQRDEKRESERRAIEVHWRQRDLIGGI